MWRVIWFAPNTSSQQRRVTTVNKTLMQSHFSLLQRKERGHNSWQQTDGDLCSLSPWSHLQTVRCRILSFLRTQTYWQPRLRSQAISRWTLRWTHSRPQSRVPFGQRHGTKALAMSNEIPVLIGWCKNKRIETGREILIWDNDDKQSTWWTV